MSRITQIDTPLSVKFVGNPLGAVVSNDFIAFTYLYKIPIIF